MEREPTVLDQLAGELGGDLASGAAEIRAHVPDGPAEDRAQALGGDPDAGQYRDDRAGELEQRHVVEHQSHPVRASMTARVRANTTARKIIGASNSPASKACRSRFMPALPRASATRDP